MASSVQRNTEFDQLLKKVQQKNLVYHDGRKFWLTEFKDTISEAELAAKIYHIMQAENKPLYYWKEIVRALRTERKTEYKPLDKQKFFIAQLQKVAPKFEVEKKLPSGRRVDVLYDLGSHVIVIEIDENAHRDRKNEELRNQDLISDFEGRPLVILRFNPDMNSRGNSAVLIKEGKVVANGTYWSIRFNNIIKRLNQYLENIPEGHFKTYYYGY